MSLYETDRIPNSISEAYRDGELNPELQFKLNKLQDHATDTCLELIHTQKAGEPFPLVAMATGIGKGRIIHKSIDSIVRKIRPLRF